MLPSRTEFVAGNREIQRIEGSTIYPKIVDPAVHVSPLTHVFIRKHSPAQMSNKVTTSTGVTAYVTRQFLQLPLLILAKEILGVSTGGYELLPQPQMSIAVIVTINELEVVMDIESRDGAPRC